MVFRYLVTRRKTMKIRCLLWSLHEPSTLQMLLLCLTLTTAADGLSSTSAMPVIRASAQEQCWWLIPLRDKPFVYCSQLYVHVCIYIHIHTIIIGVNCQHISTTWQFHAIINHQASLWELLFYIYTGIYVSHLTCSGPVFLYDLITLGHHMFKCLFLSNGCGRKP